MADRLQELLQQRALIKEHLAWLEGEISAASGRPAEIHAPEVAPSLAPLPSVRAVVAPPTRTAEPIRGKAAPAVRDDADALIARLAAAERTTPVPTKKGCWIFFWVTLVAIGLGTWAALHNFYRG